ncbi:hypothetical protein VL20_329 [Microcystis panniformis FACHB-1757]|uniref:Uncharacterized protein n=1 Tax=Microcystis panniformis FACHB-1757 TaxID=1638788 RepID=A0A0K1RUV7_9CHRO|nr:hypothetical protein VL20_329 [Microcystis panniformis FACHB-1757]
MCRTDARTAIITLDSSSLGLFRQKKPILHIPKKAAYELSRGC